MLLKRKIYHFLWSSQFFHFANFRAITEPWSCRIAIWMKFLWYLLPAYRMIHLRSSDRQWRVSLLWMRKEHFLLRANRESVILSLRTRNPKLIRNSFISLSILLLYLKQLKQYFSCSKEKISLRNQICIYLKGTQHTNTNLPNPRVHNRYIAITSALRQSSL